MANSYFDPDANPTLVLQDDTNADADDINDILTRIEASFDEVESLIGTVATPLVAALDSPTFTGTPEAPTATTGTGTTQIATCEFVANTVFAAADLPAQVGNNGKFLQTNGTDPSWESPFPTQTDNKYRTLLTNATDPSWVGLLEYEARTTVTILGVADHGKRIVFTSSVATDLTQTFTSAATLGDRWQVVLKNASNYDITLDATIDGISSMVMYPGETRVINSNGSTFLSQPLTPFYKKFTSTGTWTKPSGYKSYGFTLWGGGSSGQRNNNVSAVSIGGAGGGSISGFIPASSLGTTETITIGAGGAAVTGIANGNAGGNSSLGSVVSTINNGWNVGGFVDLGSQTSLLNDGTTSADGFGSCGATTSARDSVYGGLTPSNDASANGGKSFCGGGCGGSLNASATVRAPGISILGGDGGSASSASNGTAGSQPGGGGGATQTGTQSGAGGDGQCDIWGVC